MKSTSSSNTKTPRLSKILDGYTIAAEVRRLSPHTLADYSRTFDKLQAFLVDDVPFGSIDLQTLQHFFMPFRKPNI